MNEGGLSLGATLSRRACPGVVAVIGAAVLLLLASAWLAYVNRQAVVQSDRLSDRIAEAQLVAERLLSTLKDAGTAQRAYAQTDDETFLRSYTADLSQLRADLDRLGVASLDVAERDRRIVRIRDLLEARLRALAAAPHEPGGEDGPVQDREPLNVGTDQSNVIRAEFDALQADAVVRLTDARDASRSIAPSGTVVGLRGVAVGLLCWVGLTLSRRATQTQINTNLAHLERFIRAFGLAQGMIRDLDGRITVWSVGAERLYGYSREEAIGQISHQLLRTGLPEPLADITAELLRHGHWQGELAQYRRDGTQIYVASYWALHRGEAGEADAVIEVNNDITGLKQAEVALRHSEMKLQLALDASDQGVWRWEVGQGTFELEWDARCKSLYGFGAETRVDYARFAAAIHIEDRELVEAAVSRALDPADPYDEYACDYRVVRPNGEVHWLASQGAAVFTPDRDAPAGRRVVRIIGTMRDVSTTRRAERERQRAGALLRTLMQTAPALLFAKDRRGCMLAANEAVMDLIGRPWDEVEGRTDLEFLDDPAQAKAVMCNDRQVMERGCTERVEEAINWADGRVGVWLSSKAPMRDSSGQVIGLVGVSVEITERKQAEDHLRLMISELNHRMKTTLAMVQAITWQTLRGVDPAIRRTLEGRLHAIAAAHEVLTTEQWQGALLDDVVDGALAPFGGRDSGRFRVSGPALLLCPRAALALTMSLHELATNAVRHGALSAEAGIVEIRWEITTGDGSALRLSWVERAGPRVMPPAVPGFGTRLVERSLAQDLGGRARIGFEAPDGVTCLIEVPLAEVAITAELARSPRVGDR